MKDVHQIIEQLAPAEASAILHALASSDETLAVRITEMALTRFDQIDVKEVSADLYDELDALEVEEVWGEPVASATATSKQARPPIR
jgi:hypothetical protein